MIDLISDLFPGLNPESKTNLKLKDRVVQVTKIAHLQSEEIFIAKCIQLSESETLCLYSRYLPKNSSLSYSVLTP